MSINQVFLSGNLTRDPEGRETNSGVYILSFGLAVNDRRKTAKGDWEDYPHFVDCKIFGARAEALEEYLHKGLKIAISGKLNYSAWEAEDGQKRSKLEVIVNELEFMGAREDDGSKKRNKRY